MTPPLGIRIAGVGGQGASRAAGVLAAAALQSGLFPTVLEGRGLAVRGGAVNVLVRLAGKTGHAPRCAPGDVHVIVALEPMEAVRAAMWHRPDTALLVVGTPVLPAGVFHDRYPVPAAIASCLQQRHSRSLFVVPADCRRPPNLFAVGALACLGATGLDRMVIRMTVEREMGPDGLADFDAGWRDVAALGKQDAWRSIAEQSAFGC